jgi:hypothetical protein
MGTGGSVQDVALSYTGPGAGAAMIELWVTGSPVPTGSVVTVEAVVRDSSGAEMLDVPVAWVTDDPSLSVQEVTTVEGRSMVALRAGATPGTFSVTALLPNLVQASADVTVAWPTGDIPVLVDIPSIPGLRVAAVSLEVLRAGGEPALQVSVPWPASLPIVLAVPVSHSGEVFQISGNATDAAGTVLFTSTTPVSATPSNQSTLIPLDYVGMGADAASVEIVLDPDTPAPGDRVTATAVIRDQAGAEVTGVPVAWSVRGSLTVERTGSTGGQAHARLRLGDDGGDGEVSVLLPNGVTATVDVLAIDPTAHLQVQVQVPGYADVAPTRLRFTVRGQSGSVALDTRVPLPAPGTIDLHPVRRTPGEVFQVTVEAEDDAGMVWFGTPTPVAVADGGPVTVIPLVYVGPGIDAASVTLAQVSSDPSGLGDTVILEATVRDGSGGLILNVPMQWTPSAALAVDSSWATSQGLSAVSVTVQGPGDLWLGATAPSNAHDVRDISYTPPAARGVTLDFETYGDGSPTCDADWCPVSTEWENLGVRFSFTGPSYAPDIQGTGFPTLNTVFGEVWGGGGHVLTLDYSTSAGGMIVGTIHAHFSASVPTVQFQYRTWGYMPNIQAFDRLGNQLPASAIQVIGEPFQWFTVTVSTPDPGGIGEVRFLSGGAVIIIDDLAF